MNLLKLTPSVALAVFALFGSPSVASEVTVLMRVKGRDCDLVPESREAVESVRVVALKEGGVELHAWDTESGDCKIDPETVSGDFSNGRLSLNYGRVCEAPKPGRPLDYCVQFVRTLFTVTGLRSTVSGVEINNKKVRVARAPEG
jgi:hypothetical protein